VHLYIDILKHLHYPQIRCKLTGWMLRRITD